MAKSHELRKKAEDLYRNIKALYEKDETTAEDDAKFEQWNKEFDELMEKAAKYEAFEKKQIEEERADEVHDNLKSKEEPTAEKKREILNVALKEFYLRGRISPEARSMFQFAKHEKDDQDFIAREYERLGVRAAQQTTSDGSGGYTIPLGFQAELEKAMLAFGGMLAVSRIWRTTEGNTVEWPTVNDTMNRAYLLSEGGNAETSATKITDSQQQFEAYKITSGMLRLTSELVEDSAFNMVQVVSDFLVERMQRGINYYTTIGDGSTKPKGVVAGSVYGGSTANDTALEAADFLKLEHAVDPSYRTNGTWMFHDTVLKEIKRFSLASTAGFPIWIPSFRDGEPGTILGYRYVVNQDMAIFRPGDGTNNDGAKLVLFGDFQKYIIRLVNRMRIVRLVERFGDTDEIALCAFWRIDGDLLNAGTNPIKHLRVSAS
jgi:HK97 family phage major capsid protein